MTEKRRYTILAIILIILGIVVSMPLSGFWQWVSPYNKPLTSADMLSAEEINSFLDIYQQFQSTELSQTEENVSLRSNGTLPQQVVRWFKNRGWNAERYFAREVQIKGLMDVAKLLVNLENSRRLQKAKTGVDIQSIITQQEEKLQSLSYDKKELDLIKANLPQLNKTIKI